LTQRRFDATTLWRNDTLTQQRFVEQCFELHEPFRLFNWMPNPKLPNRAKFFAGIEVLIPAWHVRNRHPFPQYPTKVWVSNRRFKKLS
jgi:hypothetical protein